MREMTFKVGAPSKVFQCLFFKIAIHIYLPENQTFLDEQKLMLRKNFMS